MSDSLQTVLDVRVAELEAILFVSDEPLTVPVIARVLQCSHDDALSAVESLSHRLDVCGSSLHVVRIAGGYQLCTRPVYAEVVGRLLAREQSKLSKAALETLAVIAYRQPVTQPEIEAVRGVGCTSVLKTLIERNLICEQGRKPTPGRPILYATTPSFLHYFGLHDLSELPAIEKLDAQNDEAGS